MRKCRLGAMLPKRSWSPQFRVSQPRTPRTAELGAQNTAVLSYWPSPKSPNRQERLRHYWHIDMAHLLDAWPWVISWTAERNPLQIDGESAQTQFTPDFEVVARDRTYALRLVSGDNGQPRRAQQHRELRDQYRNRRGSDLEFLAPEEVRNHPHLPSARDLFFYRYHDWPDDLPRQASLMADRHRPETLGDLHACLGPKNATWEQLLSLVANGHIEIDLDGGLQPSAALLSCRIQGYGA